WAPCVHLYFRRGAAVVHHSKIQPSTSGLGHLPTKGRCRHRVRFASISRNNSARFLRRVRARAGAARGSYSITSSAGGGGKFSHAPTSRRHVSPFRYPGAVTRPQATTTAITAIASVHTSGLVIAS